jgi:uncharacterized delta-60 repeat protein
MQLRFWSLAVLFVAVGCGSAATMNDGGDAGNGDVESDGGSSSSFGNDGGGSSSDAGGKGAHDSGASDSGVADSGAHDSGSADEDAGADAGAGDSGTDFVDASLPPASGTLDGGFGSSGTATYATSGTDRYYDVAIDANGNVVVVGQTGGGLLAARYLPSGALDTSFGSAGVAVIAAGDFEAAGYALQIAPSGSIFVTGQAYRGGYPHLLVAKLQGTGALDTSFGTAGVSFPLYNPAPTTALSDSGADISLNADGTIVVVGYSESNDSQSGLVLRLTSAGALDTTFGTAGVTTYEFREGSSFNHLARQSNGNIIATGTAADDTTIVNDDLWWLARFTPNGALDKTYGGSGITTASAGNAFGSSVIVQSDGQILSGGTYVEGDPETYDFGLFRQNTNGTYDSSLGNILGEEDWLGSGTFYEGQVFDLAEQTDGKIVVAGWVLGTLGHYEMIVARRASNGAADATFATSGTLMVNAGAGDSRANAVALGNGVIYVVGWASNGANDDAVLLGIH